MSKIGLQFWQKLREFLQLSFSHIKIFQNNNSFAVQIVKRDKINFYIFLMPQEPDTDLKIFGNDVSGFISVYNEYGSTKTEDFFSLILSCEMYSRNFERFVMALVT